MAKMTGKKSMEDAAMPDDGMCGCGSGKDCSAGECCAGGCAGGACGAGMEWMPRPRSKTKSLVRLSASVFFLALTVLVLMQAFGNPWWKNIKAEVTSQPYARTITVDGEGKITTKPDIARISLSVVSADKTVKLVTDENNKKMNVIIAELKKLGIKDDDIMTSQYSLYPEYDNQYVLNAVVPSKPKSPSIIGYNLSQSIEVKIRDLTKADDVLDKATASGANEVGALSFDIDDASKIKNQAREKAFTAAHEKALQMAAAAGVKLSRVVTFSEDYNASPMPYANFAMKSMGASDEAAVAPSLAPGSKELNVNVSVTYEIE